VVQEALKRPEWVYRDEATMSVHSVNWGETSLSVSAVLDLTRIRPGDIATMDYQATYHDSGAGRRNGVAPFDLMSNGSVTWSNGSPPAAPGRYDIRVVFRNPRFSPDGSGAKREVIIAIERRGAEGTRVQELRIPVLSRGTFHPENRGRALPLVIGERPYRPRPTPTR